MVDGGKMKTGILALVAGVLFQIGPDGMIQAQTSSGNESSAQTSTKNGAKSKKAHKKAYKVGKRPTKSSGGTPLPSGDHPGGEGGRGSMAPPKEPPK